MRAKKRVAIYPIFYCGRFYSVLAKPPPSASVGLVRRFRWLTVLWTCSFSIFCSCTCCAVISSWFELSCCCTSSSWKQGLSAEGFSAIECRSIGADVVPGFHRFVEKHFNALAHVTAAKDWYKLRAVAWLLNKGHATKVIDFVIVSATNGAISAIALRCMRGMHGTHGN